MSGVSVAPGGVDTQVPQMGATTSDLGGLAQQLGRMRPPRVFGSIGDDVLDRADQAVDGAARALSASDDVAGEFVDGTAAASAGYRAADDQTAAAFGGVKLASADAPAKAGSTAGGSSGAGSVSSSLGGAAGSDVGQSRPPQSLIDQGRVPAFLEGRTAAEALDYLRDNPAQARWVATNDWYKPPTGGQDPVRAAWNAMSPDERHWTAITSAATVGNTAGVPFEDRGLANQVRITGELATEQSRLNGLLPAWYKWTGGEIPPGAALEGGSSRDLVDALNIRALETERIPMGPGAEIIERPTADSPIDESMRRIELYNHLLDTHGQVLYFDPSGDGSLVQMFGRLDANTTNAAILVPGTVSRLSNFNDFVAPRIESYVNAAPNHGLVGFGWMGGDFPSEGVPGAMMSSYARDLGTKLADFTWQVKQEIANSPAAVNDPQLTVAGHSYGGAVVGNADAHNMYADRVLHIESAGMGYGVYAPSDLHNANPQVQRYSMTAPGDYIQLTQGSYFSPHGADPDTFPGVTRLETGHYADGTPIQGFSAHRGAVNSYHSDAWWNIYNVFTGGRVVPYQGASHALFP